MIASKNFLSEILKARRTRVEKQKSEVSIERLREEALHRRRKAEPHALHRALSDPNSRTKIIAEYKRASPSRGKIRADWSPKDAAQAYQAGGASAISVLTEEDYFHGAIDDLREIKEAVDVPILRKDFILDDFQVYETAAAGADAILLIAAALDDDTLLRLLHLSEDELGLDVLLEVHTAEEMERACNSGARIIGVNNRDLENFDVDLDTSVRLAKKILPGRLLVSESGIKSRDDIRLLASLGYHAFLIGEILMRSPDPQTILREFAGSNRNLP